jgi:hypothetical protein
MTDRATQSPDLETVTFTDEASAVRRMRNEAAIRLLKAWMADESGYDEEA